MNISTSEMLKIISETGGGGTMGLTTNGGPECLF